jgi:hypothetical protein
VFRGGRHALGLNRTFYLAATLATAGLLATPFRIAALVAIFWICCSLLISTYVYDFSPLYRFDWLHLPNPPRF